jgi:hypothetical protein
MDVELSIAVDIRKMVLEVEDSGGDGDEGKSGQVKSLILGFCEVLSMRPQSKSPRSFVSFSSSN